MYKSVKLKDRKSVVIKKSTWKLQARDSNGRFGCVKTETVKKSSRDSCNCRDFKIAKEKLLAIQCKKIIGCWVQQVSFLRLISGRSYNSDKSLQFKIICKKINTKNPTKSFNWTSPLYVEDQINPVEESSTQDSLVEAVGMQKLLEEDKPRTYDIVKSSTHIG